MTITQLSRCLVVFPAFVLLGCIGPRPVVMDELDIPFAVIDEITRSPLAGAVVTVVYKGPNGERRQGGPFISDESARGRISLRREVLWLKATDLYFVGGYVRSIHVRVGGYEDGGLHESLGEKTLNEIGSMVFELKPRRPASGG